MPPPPPPQRAVALIAGLAIAACEKASTPTTTPTREGDAAPRVVAAFPRAPAVEESEKTKRFFDMSAAEKRAHMVEVVAPRLGERFREFDRERFAVFACSTCHGYLVPGAPMARPHSTLPTLVLSGDGLEKLKAAQPELVAFMSDVVVPEMRKAMGEPSFDCAGCHQVQ